MTVTVFTGLCPVLVAGAIQDSISPLAAILFCLVTAAVTFGHRRSFIAGLYVTCFLVLPKWIRDDWTSRAAYSNFRRILIQVLIVYKQPKWDASLVFDERLAKVDWGTSEDWSNIKLGAKPSDMTVVIDFWEDVVPTNSGDSVAIPTQLSNTCNAPTVAAEASPTVKELMRLAERMGITSIAGIEALDSLQAISLAELIRREMGKEISVRDVLNSADICELAARVEATKRCTASFSTDQQTQTGETADADGAFRAYIMRFDKSPVDWCVHHDGSLPLDIDAMQNACDRLVARHSALQTVATPDEPIRDIMDVAAAMWQLWTSCFGGCFFWHSIAKLVGSALFSCWPRTFTQSAEAARLSVKLTPPVGDIGGDDEWWGDQDDRAFQALTDACRADRRYPMDIAVVPTSSPTSWYLYLSITHAYSDGSTGQALFSDFLHMYEQEVLKKTRENRPNTAEHFCLLQRRLRKSLLGRLHGNEDSNNDLYHEIVCEDWGLRPGMQRKIHVNSRVLEALRFSSTDVLGCSIDVAWLTAIVGAVFRLFPHVPYVRLILKAGCRDGPGEREMVGFLSEQRTFVIDAGDLETATLLEIASKLTSTRRSRAWRAPMPFEAGLSIYVNIVSSMTESLPSGFRHAVRPSKGPLGYDWSMPAYSHINFRLDHLAPDKWDFRIFHWDAEWGWEWSSHFCAAFGAVIGDMVLRPTQSLLEANHPPPSARAVANPPAMPLRDSYPSAKRKAASLSNTPDEDGETTKPRHEGNGPDIPAAELHGPTKVPRTDIASENDPF